MFGRLLVVLVALAGCLGPDPEPSAEAPTLAAHPAIVESHDATVSNLGVSVCSQTQVDGGAAWETKLALLDNDTGLAIRADWAPINPTVETLHFRLTEYAGDFVLEWHVASPFEVEFQGSTLAGLPRPAFLTVSAWGCGPDDAVTAQAAPPFVAEQAVRVQVAWNGAQFE